MGNPRKSKALLWAGFATYILLSIIASLVVAYTDASLLMAQPVTNAYLFDVNFYKLIIFLDKPMLFAATLFTVYMDSNPGKNLFKEVLADVAFIAGGWTSGGFFYAIVYSGRLRYLAQAQGGMVLTVIDNFTTQVVFGVVYLVILIISIQTIHTLTKDKSNPDSKK